MSRILSDIMPGNSFGLAPVSIRFKQWFDLLHRYSLGVFAVLFLGVASLGIQVASVYWTAHFKLLPSTTSAVVRIPAQSLAGPNLLIYSDQLTSTLQRITSQPITLTFGDKTVAMAPADIRSWLQVAVDHQRNVAHLRVDDAAISSSVTRLLTPLVTSPTNQVTATYADGSSAVIVAGHTGTTLSDPSQLTKQIATSFLSGKGLQLTAPLQTVPFQAVTPAAFPKLLEINVATKQMWAYENGQLVRSFLVSAGAPATPTPLGQYKIYEKLPVQDMSGYNPNGTKYFQPHVQYVNYFTGGDAIHAVYWHPDSFFGNINSSHGCVGVQTSDGQWIYDWAPIGTTVITHV